MSKCSLNEDLKTADEELYEIIVKEKHRQKCGLEMIASENFTSRAVLQALGSCFHIKTSEGLPGARYYGGTEFIDEMELLCQRRACELYDLDQDMWGANVQPYSGSPANFAVYTAIVGPHGRIMGLDLPDGGHLSHGYFTPTKNISATSLFFESMPYKVDPTTGLIDYDKLAESARLFKPKMIIAGVSCYSRNLDYSRFRDVADEHESYLMADMSHVAGLVAAKLVPSPFDYCDIVTTTIYKTLRGPRAGIVFFRKGVRSVKKSGENILYDLESKINMSVFPGLQGAPHNHTIAAIAVAFKQAKTPEFVKYQEMVIRNAQALCRNLQQFGYTIATGGTDTHMLLVDVRYVGLTGGKAEKLLEEIGIVCNKNAVPGDKTPFNPSGLRFGTPALTTRGLIEEDMSKVAEFIHRGLNLAKEIQKISGPKLVDFKRVIQEDADVKSKIQSIRSEVQTFALKFPVPGIQEY